MVQSMDLNGDKMVSTQELSQAACQASRFCINECSKNWILMAMEVLVLQELKKSQQWKLERMFYRLDKNNDGFIVKEEAQTAKKNILKR